MAERGREYDRQLGIVFSGDRAGNLGGARDLTDLRGLVAFFLGSVTFCGLAGDVAQLGERGVRNAEVEGSIPFVSIQYRNINNLEIVARACA